MPKTDIARQTVTLQELAKLIGCSDNTLWRKRKAGTLPSQLVMLQTRPGESVRFTLASVEEYLGTVIDTTQLDFAKLPSRRADDEVL